MSTCQVNVVRLTLSPHYMDDLPSRPPNGGPTHTSTDIYNLLADTCDPPLSPTPTTYLTDTCDIPFPLTPTTYLSRLARSPERHPKTQLASWLQPPSPLHCPHRVCPLGDPRLRVGGGTLVEPWSTWPHLPLPRVWSPLRRSHPCRHPGGHAPHPPPHPPSGSFKFNTLRLQPAATHRAYSPLL